MVNQPQRTQDTSHSEDFKLLELCRDCHSKTRKNYDNEIKNIPVVAEVASLTVEPKSCCDNFQNCLNGKNARESDIKFVYDEQFKALRVIKRMFKCQHYRRRNYEQNYDHFEPKAVR